MVVIESQLAVSQAARAHERSHKVSGCWIRRLPCGQLGGGGPLGKALNFCQAQIITSFFTSWLLAETIIPVPCRMNSTYSPWVNANSVSKQFMLNMTVFNFVLVGNISLTVQCFEVFVNIKHKGRLSCLWHSDKKLRIEWKLFLNINHRWMPTVSDSVFVFVCLLYLMHHWYHFNKSTCKIWQQLNTRWLPQQASYINLL